MVVSGKKLLRLSVYTRSGVNLGKIHDFDMDTISHKIVKYYVKNQSFLGNLIEKELIIASNQVISITEEKMIVKDLVIEENSENIGKKLLEKKEASFFTE